MAIQVLLIAGVRRMRPMRVRMRSVRIRMFPARVSIRSRSVGWILSLQLEILGRVFCVRNIMSVSSYSKECESERFHNLFFFVLNFDKFGCLNIYFLPRINGHYAMKKLSSLIRRL